MKTNLKRSWKCENCLSQEQEDLESSCSDTSVLIEAEAANPSKSTDESLSRKMDRVLKKIGGMEDSMKFYNANFEDIKTSMEEFVKSMREIKEENEELRNENLKLNREVNYLKSKVNMIEQTNLDTTIEIKGIPETKNEDINTILKDLADKMNISETDRVFESAFRLKIFNATSPDSPSRRNRALSEKVIVKFLTRQQKKIWTQKKKEFKDITATDVHPSFPNNKLYINERLTPQNGTLFCLARKFGKEYEHKFVWTSNGNIYVKKDDTIASRAYRITDINQLQKMDTRKAIHELHN
ncbi:hypothetical protein GE061_006831 [Apolygus lucorum]|uniref:Uncharacterized protein n=1 Tax=Apolygus lucorum TaxID=248454 RepID=A0A8S9WRQ4_APOLU|nr:hypothetical protein GE061_006831 [Apolygus lucorum]